MPETSLLTRREAMAWLRVSESTLYRRVCDGDIAAVRVGKRGVRIDAASVQAYLRANRRLPPSIRTEEPL